MAKRGGDHRRGRASPDALRWSARRREPLLARDEADRDRERHAEHEPRPDVPWRSAVPRILAASSPAA